MKLVTSIAVSLTPAEREKLSSDIGIDIGYLSANVIASFENYVAKELCGMYMTTSPTPLIERVVLAPLNDFLTRHHTITIRHITVDAIGDPYLSFTSGVADELTATLCGGLFSFRSWDGQEEVELKGVCISEEMSELVQMFVTELLTSIVKHLKK